MPLQSAARKVKERGKGKSRAVFAIIFRCLCPISDYCFLFGTLETSYARMQGFKRKEFKGLG